MYLIIENLSLESIVVEWITKERLQPDFQRSFSSSREKEIPSVSISRIVVVI